MDERIPKESDVKVEKIYKLFKRGFLKEDIDVSIKTFFIRLITEKIVDNIFKKNSTFIKTSKL